MPVRSRWLATTVAVLCIATVFGIAIAIVAASANAVITSTDHGVHAHAKRATQAALAPQDLYFVTQTSLGTQFQIDSGQLAEQKGGTQAIRSYAQLMVSSHKAVGSALQAILQRKGPLPPPTLLKAAYETNLSTLRDEAGRPFDDDYVRGQVNYQTANVALYQYEIANGSDTDLTRFAQQTLPKIKDHLQKALELEERDATR
jgi:putative membrane protein